MTEHRSGRVGPHEGHLGTRLIEHGEPAHHGLAATRNPAPIVHQTHARRSHEADRPSATHDEAFRHAVEMDLFMGGEDPRAARAMSYDAAYGMGLIRAHAIASYESLTREERTRLLGVVHAAKDEGVKFRGQLRWGFLPGPFRPALDATEVLVRLSTLEPVYVRDGRRTVKVSSIEELEIVTNRIAEHRSERRRAHEARRRWESDLLAKMAPFTGRFFLDAGFNGPLSNQQVIVELRGFLGAGVIMEVKGHRTHVTSIADLEAQLARLQPPG